MNVAMAPALKGDYRSTDTFNIHWFSYCIKPKNMPPVAVFVHPPSHYMVMTEVTDNPLQTFLEQYSLMIDEAAGFNLSVVDGLLSSKPYRRELPDKWNCFRDGVEELIDLYFFNYEYGADALRSFSHRVNEFDVGAGSAFTRHMAYHGQKEAKNHYNYGQLGISSGFSKYCLQQSIQPEFGREVWI